MQRLRRSTRSQAAPAGGERDDVRAMPAGGPQLQEVYHSSLCSVRQRPGLGETRRCHIAAVASNISGGDDTPRLDPSTHLSSESFHILHNFQLFVFHPELQLTECFRIPRKAVGGFSPLFAASC